MSKCLLLSVLLYSVIAVVNSQECINPKSTISSYTSSDTSVLTKTGFITTFTLLCDNIPSSSSPPPLYWLLTSPTLPSSDGRPLPAIRAANNKYQVSWTEDSPSSGQRQVLVYSEEGYTALRKAIRSGEPIESVPTLLTVSIPYSAGYTGPTVSSEILAALASIGVAYLAIRNKSKLSS